MDSAIFFVFAYFLIIIYGCPSNWRGFTLGPCSEHCNIFLVSQTSSNSHDLDIIPTCNPSSIFSRSYCLPALNSFAVCCTFFSVFGAFFLFCLSGLMSIDYAYLHMPGDVIELSKPVAYAGLIYLGTALLSIIFWVRGNMKRKAFEENLKRGAINDGNH